MSRRGLLMTSKKEAATNGNYLTFVALEDNFRVGFTCKSAIGTNGLNNGTVYYRVDDGIWTPISAGENTTGVWKGQRIQFKANAVATSSGIGTFNTSASLSTGKFNLEGNVNSLFFGDHAAEVRDLTNYDYGYLELFMNSNVVEVSDNFLPATTLAQDIYSYMFAKCPYLTKGPNLPATTLNIRCYRYMFYNSAALLEAPALPATTLRNNCYYGMFMGCSSLTAAPALPAKKVVTGCYASMFRDCTSLWNIPTELIATSVASNGYNGMFYNCRAITRAPIIRATSVGDYAMKNMFYDCLSMETGPTILPATTLAVGCYAYMFAGCKVMENAPTLPATEMKTDCYAYLFYQCKKVNSVTTYCVTTISGLWCDSWMYDVAATGVMYITRSVSIVKESIHGLPTGWTTSYID